MLLNELELGSKVTILVRIGSQTLGFDTQMEDRTDDGILAEPIYRNDKLIGFKGAGIIITLQITNVADQRVYEFTNAEIINVKTKDGKVHHKMTCKNPGKQINRRTAVRVWIGIEGVAQIGINRTAHSVTVKDLSVSGVSFLSHKQIDAKPGTMEHVNFHDEESKVKFSLGAVIVRIAEMEDGRVLYGCRLNNQDSPAISKYVAELQREKLKGSRTVGTSGVAEK